MAVTPHFHNHFHNTLQFSEFFIPIGWIPFSRLVPLVPLYLYTWKNYYSHKKQSIYINLFILFFYFSFNLFILICYLAAPQPTFGHSLEGSLTNPNLIIFKQKVTGSLVARLGPKDWLSTYQGLNRDSFDSEFNTLTH